MLTFAFTIMQFANDLKMKGIKVNIFNDMHLGEYFFQFMEKIHDSDFTLIICTPEYKRKADKRLLGVGRETDIMTAIIGNSDDNRKIIPILFSGDWNCSVPRWAIGKKGVDYRESSITEFNKLISNLRTYEESKDCIEIDENEVVPQKNEFSRDREKKMMRIREVDGSESVVEVILSFSFKDTGREFIIFSPPSEITQADSSMVHVASVTRQPNDEIILGDVEERDWGKIVKLIQELSKNENRG